VVAAAERPASTALEPWTSVIGRLGSAAQELADLDVHALSPERQTQIAMAIVRRDTGIMATACLVIFLLALRAAGTSSAF